MIIYISHTLSFICSGWIYFLSFWKTCKKGIIQFILLAFIQENCKKGKLDVVSEGFVRRLVNVHVFHSNFVWPWLLIFLISLKFPHTDFQSKKFVKWPHHWKIMKIILLELIADKNLLFYVHAKGSRFCDIERMPYHHH